MFARTFSKSTTWVPVCGLLLGAAGCSQVNQPIDTPELTIEALESSPSLSGPRVVGVKVAPDGQRVTFLRGKETNFEQQDLWEYHVGDDELRLLVDSEALIGGESEELSEEEIARRERQRVRGSGIVEYYWNDQGTALLFPLAGDLYYLPLDGEPRRLTESEEFETDVRFSPRGNYASFIRSRDLYVVEIDSGREIRLTRGASDTIAHGVAEFIAQEEMSRYTGYWWSPDESKIAFTKIDESPVNVVQRYEVNPDGSVTTREQRYPAAGTDNVLIDLGVVEVASGTTSWIDLGEDRDIYLARVDWLRDSETVAFQRLPRDQSSLDVVFASADGASQSLVVREDAKYWINLHKDLRFLESRDQFVWSSERSGYRHLYLLGNDGTMVGALTEGEWVVREVVSVDEEKGLVFFEGFADTTLEKHLYSVSLDPDPSSLRKISREEGWHEIKMGKKGGEVFLDQFSAPEQPPQVAIRSSETGETLTFISENPLDESHPYAPYLAGHASSEFGELAANDGTMLDYELILPPDLDRSKKYPAVLAPYGGPHGHRVGKTWDLGFNQVLARRGFVVMVIDNRGSYDRGVEFEGHVKNAMGTVEIEDQVSGVEFLRSLSYIDGDNIGIHGWSYGGYMALMCLFQAPDHFKAGVSGAPVTSWRLYDTGYTERYLGHPDSPGEVYDKSSVFRYIDGFKGDLLLIHGMADDNVFFDNSVQLMSILQKTGRSFELMTYPGQRHRFRDRSMRVHQGNLKLEFLEEKLKNG